MNLRLSLALSLFLSFTSVLPAGEALPVSGMVTDPQGRAVPGAAVSLFSRTGHAEFRTSAGPTGSYEFKNVAAGDYLLRAEAPGFAAFVSATLSVSAPLTQDITLRLAGVRDQVVVTATGTPLAPGELARAVAVVDPADVRQRDVASLTAALELLPGVRVQQLGGPGQLATIDIRGMRDRDTAVLLDGLRLRDSAALHGDASGMIQDLLLNGSGRIEVMNGAGSSLYGTNAVGGVVNIISDEGGGKTRGGVLAEGGSLGTLRGRAQVAGGAAEDRLRYSAGLSYVNVTSGVDGDDPFRDTSAQGRMSYRFSPAAVLSARFLGADSFAKLNASPFQIGVLPATGIIDAAANVNFLPAANDPDSTRAGRFLNGALVFDGQPSAKFHYTLVAQILASSRRYGNGPAGIGFQPGGNQRSLYDGRVETLNGQFHYRPVASQLITGGYEFERENYAFDFTDQSDPGGASSTNVAQKSHAIFIQDQARFLDGRLIVTGGFRAQYFTLQRPVFSPLASAPYAQVALSSPPAAYTGDGAAAYFIRRSSTKVRAHVGRGYRAPSLYERFGAGWDSFFGYSTYGDPRLEPEHSLSFDGGVDQQLLGGRLQASASYFYTRLQRTVTFFNQLSAGDPYGRFFGYGNGQGGLSRGVELSARVSPLRGLEVSAAYSFINAVERTPVVGDVLRTFVIPRHQFSAAAAWRVSARTMLTFDTLAASNYLDPVTPDFVKSFTTRVYRFAGPHRFNAGVSHRMPLRESRAVRVFVRAENLGGQVFYENGFRTPGRTANAGIEYEF